MSGSSWVGVALLGGVGAVTRWCVDVFVSQRVRCAVPLGILLVNVTGSFALGVTVGLGTSDGFGDYLGTGLIGGYTTFSTWLVQTEELLRHGRFRSAALNWVGSVIAGVGAAAVGWWLGALAG